MGVMFDYFAAPSDEAAASTIDVVGGPAAASPHGFPTVMLKGIDPVVQMGTLEEILTGVSYETVTANPRSGHALATHDEGECVVVALTDELQAALADTNDVRLREAAVSWAHTDESW